MKVWLDKDWYIDQIPLNYVVVHRKMSFGNAKNKTPEPKLVDDVIGYCNDNRIENALRLYVNARIKRDSENFEGSLDDYMVKIQDITNNCVQQMAKIYGNTNGKG
mgnify:CR=1 FL=1